MSEPSDVDEFLSFDCDACGAECNPLYECDRLNGKWCGRCFDAATHCNEAHDGQCKTVVWQGEST